VRDAEVRTGESGRSGYPDGEALARLAAAGDEGAWAAIFERHFGNIYAFVRSRVGRPEVAEDLAAQVFEIAFSRSSHFDYRGVPIEAWLIGIARNVVRDHLKRLARRGPETELVEAVAPVEPDATAAVALRQDLAEAMRHLTEDQQTVLALRFLLDRPVEETARLMARSEDAVKTLQRRALAAMQRALAGHGYGGGGGG
jgi:RNA polymerase sigma-70 factor (ECF subfamily)